MKKIFQLKNPQYEVHITFSRSSNSPKLTGTLYDDEGYPVAGVKPKTRTAKNKKEVKYLQQQIVNAFEEQMKPKVSHKRPKGLAGIGYIDPRIEDAFYKVEKSGKLDDEWARATINRYIPKVKKHILTAISPPETFDFKRRELLEEEIKESIEKNAKKPNKSNIRSNVQVYLHAGQVVYKMMQEVDPTLPNLKIEADSRRMPILRREMPKHIPISVQEKFEEAVRNLIYIDPFLARAIAIFHSGATRNSEAASVIWSDLIIHPEYVLVNISTQEIEGERNPILKTSAAYRTVVLDAWGTEIVREAQALIGNNEEQNIAPISSKKLSKCVKDLLIECGLSDAYIKIAELDMEQTPDYYEDGTPETDVTAYILRRNRAGIWGNYCSLYPIEIDYLLGHKRIDDSVKIFDEKNPESFDKIASKILTFNFSEYVKDKDYSQVNLEGIKGRTLPETPKIKIINNTNKTIKVKIFFRSKEPGDVVRVSTFGKVTSYHKVSRQHITRPYTTLFGHIEEGD